MVVDLKWNYLFVKKIVESEMGLEPTALLIVIRSHFFCHKIKIRSV